MTRCSSGFDFSPMLPAPVFWVGAALAVVLVALLNHQQVKAGG